jgi:hypothetical protein
MTDEDDRPIRGRRDTHEQIYRLERDLTGRIAGVEVEARSGAVFGRRIARVAVALALASVGALGTGLSLLQRSVAAAAVRDEKIHRLEREVERLLDRPERTP